MIPSSRARDQQRSSIQRNRPSAARCTASTSSVSAWRLALLLAGFWAATYAVVQKLPGPPGLAGCELIRHVKRNVIERVNEDRVEIRHSGKWRYEWIKKLID